MSSWRRPRHGAAAVSTDVGGIGEIYGPGHRQRLIPANDATILAGAIKAMIETPAAERLARAADLAGHVRQNFRLDDMVDGVIAGYRDALKARGIA